MEHIDEKIKKAAVGVNLMRKLNLLLPRSSLLTVYKCFIRPHLDYGDVIKDQPNLSSLANKIKSVQYYAALAITVLLEELPKRNYTKSWVLNL